MKLPFVFILLTSLCISLYAYNTVPISYYGVKYGYSPKEVNDALVSNNFISAPVEPEVGFFYKHPYSDPELTYFDKATSRWMNVSFTKIKPIELYKRDASISFAGVVNKDEYKRITIRQDNINKEDNVVSTPWVYRFYFHYDKLIAVSLRLEDEGTLEDFKANNPDNPNAHPGYIIDDYVFRVNKNKFIELYGGFDQFATKSINERSAMYYGGYLDSRRKVELVIFYQERNSNKKYANLTISYFDTYLFDPVARSFQNVNFVENEYNDGYYPVSPR